MCACAISMGSTKALSVGRIKAPNFSRVREQYLKSLFVTYLHRFIQQKIGFRVFEYIYDDSYTHLLLIWIFFKLDVHNVSRCL